MPDSSTVNKLSLLEARVDSLAKQCTETELRGEVAALRAQLRERDDRIAALQAECSRLQANATAARAALHQHLAALTTFTLPDPSTLQSETWAPTAPTSPAHAPASAPVASPGSASAVPSVSGAASAELEAGPSSTQRVTPPAPASTTPVPEPAPSKTKTPPRRASNRSDVSLVDVAMLELSLEQEDLESRVAELEDQLRTMHGLRVGHIRWNDEDIPAGDDRTLGELGIPAGDVRLEVVLAGASADAEASSKPSSTTAVASSTPASVSMTQNYAAPAAAAALATTASAPSKDGASGAPSTADAAPAQAPTQQAPPPPAAAANTTATTTLPTGTATTPPPAPAGPQRHAPAPAPPAAPVHSAADPDTEITAATAESPAEASQPAAAAAAVALAPTAGTDEASTDNAEQAPHEVKYVHMELTDEQLDGSSVQDVVDTVMANLQQEVKRIVVAGKSVSDHSATLRQAGFTYDCEFEVWI